MARFMFYDDKIINILNKEEQPSGGAAVQAYSWIKGLAENGHEVIILTNKIENKDLKEEALNYRIEYLFDKHKGIKWLRWGYYRLPYIYKKIKQSKPDFLYQGVPGWPSFFIGIICRLLKVKYIIRISNDYLLDKRILINYSRFHSYFQKLGFKTAHFILCQNNYQYAIVKRKYPHKQVAKFPNPFFLKYKHAPSTTHQRSYIAWIGLYQYQKNLKLLYDIASSMKDEHFHIAGKESSKCDAETSLYLNKLKSLPNVKFVGFLQRNQVLEFLAKAKYLLNTSHYEGFSNTFLEAMTVGTPIITSTQVNPDGIISENKLGIVYRNSADLIEQYKSISEAECLAMTTKVSSYVAEEHNYLELSRKLVIFLERGKINATTYQESSQVTLCKS